VFQEVLDRKPYTFSADVYSYAIALYHIFMDIEPYVNFKHSWQVAEYILRGQRLDLTSRVPKEIRDLIGVSWAQNPDDRNPFNEIANFLMIIRENMAEVIARTEKERADSGDDVLLPDNNPANNPLWAEARERKNLTATSSTNNKQFAKHSSQNTSKTATDPRSAGAEPKNAGSHPKSADDEPKNAGSHPKSADDEPKIAGSHPKSEGSGVLIELVDLKQKNKVY